MGCLSEILCLCVSRTLGDKRGLAGLLLPGNSVFRVLVALFAVSALLLGEVDLRQKNKKTEKKHDEKRVRSFSARGIFYSSCVRCVSCILVVWLIAAKKGRS